jgi:hypothetical protein
MTDAPKPNLIFMIGLTGSGKSRLKKELVKEFPIQSKFVSVDDVFEYNPESIEIFHELYKGHFGTEHCSDINKLTEEKPINTYLNILFPDPKENKKNKEDYSITRDCVLSQISYRYPEEKTENISFSKFASAIYFALRVKSLNREYDESIQNSVKEGKNVIIETNGESVDSITAWYQGESQLNNNTEKNPCRAEGGAIDLKTELKEYNKIVCFLRRDICDTVKDLKNRALEKVCDFIKKNDNNNEEKTGPIPRLPEIDNESLQIKMEKINGTYKAFKEDINGDKYKLDDVRVYVNKTHIEKVNNLPRSLYETTEIQCNNPKTTGGRKSKRRKSKRRKSKRRRLTKSKK